MPPEETQPRDIDRAASGVYEHALIHPEAAEKAAELPAVMISVPIKSKLGLEPSDHHQNNPRKTVEDPLPAKRARIRRQRW